MNALGLSTACRNTVSEALFAEYADAGIDRMEISLPTEAYEQIPWKDCRRWAERSGVKLWSLHLPFLPFSSFDPASLDPAVRANTVSYMTALMERAAEAGIAIAVIHPSGEPIADADRATAFSYAQETLALLADNAARLQMTLAVENLPRTCLGRDADEMQRLLAADPRLRSCFDTNHLLGQDALFYLSAVGDRVVTLHVSDYDFKNERHWLPGEGLIDWNALASKLQEIGYDGPFLYELNFEPSITIDRRPLTARDIRDNFEALMRGNRPAPIGTPIAERCTSWK